MATLSAATSSLLPDWQVNQYQARLQQARRAADQAESRVRDLEAQTDRARSNAVQAEDVVRGVERQAPQGHQTVPPSILNTQGQITGRVLHVVA